MTASLRTPAERLLFELCRTAPSAEIVEREARAGGPDGLDRLNALAMRHGVQGLVLGRLSALQARDGVWRESADEVSAALVTLKRQTAFWDMEQDRVLGGLARAGFDPVVLKGGALRRSVFTPLERAMGDLDILVEPREVRAILEALHRLGYRSEYPDRAREEFLEHHHHDRVAHPAGFLVEVHWGLTRPGEPIRLDARRFLDRSVTVEAPGAPPLRIPRAEDTLVHTVSQSEQDSVRGLRRLVDLDRIAASPGLDWDDVRRHADETGLHPTLCLTLRLANLLLGTEAPPDLLAGRGLTETTRRTLALLRPVRRLLDDPGRADVVEFHLFRLWCARPDHRDRWLRMRVAGRGDPLHWVWAGGEEPDEVDRERTTGASFLLKLALYQSILSVDHVLTRMRHPGDPAEDFWLSAAGAARPTRS